MRYPNEQCVSRILNNVPDVFPGPNCGCFGIPGFARDDLRGRLDQQACLEARLRIQAVWGCSLRAFLVQRMGHPSGTVPYLVGSCKSSVLEEPADNLASLIYPSSKLA